MNLVMCKFLILIIQLMRPHKIMHCYLLLFNKEIATVTFRWISKKPRAPERSSPSLPPGHPRTAPCLSSCCRSRPGPHSHPRRSPQRIWERHVGSRPGCWALTSQSTAATISVPPRHCRPTLSVGRHWGVVETRATGKTLPNLNNLESGILFEKYVLVETGEDDEQAI